jgi:hypothetical protein
MRRVCDGVDSVVDGVCGCTALEVETTWTCWRRWPSDSDTSENAVVRGEGQDGHCALNTLKGGMDYVETSVGFLWALAQFAHIILKNEELHKQQR